MADWTEAAVREALACVEAEWDLCSVTVGMGCEAVTVEPATRPRIEIESWSGDGSIKARWLRGDGICGEIGVATLEDETVESRAARRRKPSEIPAALLALRTLVIATHGPEAWPWAMRETERKAPPVHFGVHGTGQFWSTGCYGPMWLVKRVSTDPSETESRAMRRAQNATAPAPNAADPSET